MGDLTDTSILIQQLRGNPCASELLNYLAKRGRPLISPVTVAESYVGCQNERHFRGARSLIRRFRTVPITATVGEKTAHLIRQYPQFFGKNIDRGFADALILACAWERNAVLWTLNTRHFVNAQIVEVAIRAIDPTLALWR